MRRPASLWLVFALLALAAVAQELTPPAGWLVRRERGVTVFVPPEGDFQLAAHPRESLTNQSFEDWFEDRVAADLRPRGRILTKSPIDRRIAAVYMLVADVREPGGQRVRMIYNGVRQGDGATLVVIRAHENLELLRPHLSQSSRIVTQLAGIAAQGSAPAPRGTGQPVRAAAQPDNEDARLRTITATPPGSGVQPDRIVAVLHEGRGEYEVTGYQYVESVDLLLEDGTAYRNLRLPPEDLNVSASRRLEPDQWTRWRRAGAGFEFLDPKTGRWEKAEAAVVRPLPPGGQLNRKLIHRKAYTFGGFGGSVFTTEFRFLPDGRFERSDGSLSGTGAVQAAGGFSSSAATQADKTGRSGAASGTGTLEGASGSSTVTATGSSSSREGAGDQYGVYRVTGLTLELRAQSGRIRRLLAFYPDPKDDDIYIAGDTFHRPGKY